MSEMYETPTLTDIGTLQELTMQPNEKDFGFDDGVVFQGQAIGSI
ncbi:MAG: lasso RiPP family leader peptide-containing protein [Egibacteraceae bacterium]